MTFFTGIHRSGGKKEHARNTLLSSANNCSEDVTKIMDSITKPSFVCTRNKLDSAMMKCLDRAWA